MNAPWVAQKTAQAGTRDLLAAFLQDDDTIALLKAAATDIGWPTDRMHGGGLRNAVQTLAVSNSPQVLIVDLSGSADPRADINSLAEVCEPGTLVLAMGSINDVALYRDLIASGLQDYLVKPFDQQMLRDALYSVQQVLQGAQAKQQEADVEHLTVTVIGTRGGVGASSIATSLAWTLAHAANRKTALLDLDLQFGIGAMAFDLEPGRGMMDAVENPNRIDNLFIERAIVKESADLSILSAEAPINQPLHVEGAALQHLESELSKMFDVVIVDMPRQTAVQHPHLLHEIDHVIVVTELTLAGARDSIRLLSFIKSNCPSARVCFVANKVSASGGNEVTQKDFEASVERPLDIIIPLDMKTALNAARKSQCLAEAAKGTKTHAAFTSIARSVTTINEGPSASGIAALLTKFNDIKAKVKTKA